MKNKIIAELDNTKGFEPRTVIYEEQTDMKVELVKRIYRILRRKLRDRQREEVQSQALSTANWFI